MRDSNLDGMDLPNHMKARWQEFPSIQTKEVECGLLGDRLALGCGEGSATSMVMVSAMSDWPTSCPESMKVETWFFQAESSLSWENAHLSHLIR